MSRHILVIGASGQVGYHLLRAASWSGVEAVGTYSSSPVEGLAHLDIRRPAEVRALVERIEPAAIFLAAAMTHVDRCESEPELTREVNVAGPAHVARAAAGVGARLVFFSSDYVFNGRDGPYSEEILPSPISEYGRQKAEAEAIVAEELPDSHVIVRTTGVYGWEPQGKNFVIRVIRTLEEGEGIAVPADQVATPTYAPNLADASLVLGAGDFCGVYNVAGPDLLTRADFAAVVAKVFGLAAQRIEAVETSTLGQTAPRPLNGGLRTEKVVGATRIQMTPPVEGLTRMKASERVGGV